MIYDNHGRKISYLRLAVTDRCNLRCFYCMPEEGIDFVRRKDLLSFEEMYEVVSLLTQMGISKLRITGGEPFVRKGMMEFLESLGSIEHLNEIHITTNGTLTTPYIPRLKALGVSGINLSLDSLDRWNFESITRKDKLLDVMDTFHQCLEHEIPLKINMVVMDGRNTDEILSMIELTKHHKVEVRFIEEMPFNGADRMPSLKWNFVHIKEHIEKHYPDIQRLSSSSAETAMRFKVNDYAGSFGIIPAYSRTFCGSCNRIRLTPVGELRTCLYGPPQLQVRDVIRDENQGVKTLKNRLLEVLQHRAKDGFEAEKQLVQGKHESMSSIGG